MPDVSAVPGPDPLSVQVEAAFADGGRLAGTLPAFEPRAGQRAMAAAVADSLERGEILLAEAGTGTGKTLAYLVPAILSRQRILISTGTKNLQDQITDKDIPALRAALKVPFKAVLMKGRGNYLCLHRFEAALNRPAPKSAVDRGYLETIEQWAEQTETGDRSEIEDLPDSLPLWQDLAATSEHCLGTDCELYDQCFVTRMRRRAFEAHLIIVNHHLLCADAGVRQGPYGQVIPECESIVVDEAHQLEEVATHYFGVGVSAHRLDKLARDVHDVAAKSTALAVESAEALHRIADAAGERARTLFRELLALAGGGTRDVRVTADALAPAKAAADAVLETLTELTAQLDNPKVNRSHKHPEELALELTSLARRAREAGEDLTFLMASADPAYVYFLERRGAGVHLRAAPIEVSGIIRDTVLQRHHSAVLTSATLAVDASFDYVKTRLGVSEAREIRLASEFDFARQAILYLPRRMPDPRSERFAAAVAREIVPLLKATVGRAFVLFTSHAALRAVSVQAAKELGFPLLIQGSAPRRVLLREFRTTPHAVLFATSSFWQGVDVVGEALSCVVIDKLPFASPGDPVTAARMEAISERGADPFQTFQVPVAILALQQGLGRLIRHRTDRGVLALLDPRIRTRGYGHKFLASLPPAPITSDIADVARFMAAPASAGPR